MRQLVPLGDQAALAYFDNEEAALGFAAAVRSAAFDWLADVVQAYASVAVYFDLAQISFHSVAQELQAAQTPATGQEWSASGKHHVIPCCYELGPDLERVAQIQELSTEEVIRLHTTQEYTVYAIGFCPGFPYLGYLPVKLTGVPRLATPRVRVEEGAVGLTGRQTGIYTQPRPGGWNLIGRTPLQLVDVADGYFPLRTGDGVRFQRVDQAEFQRLWRQRL